MDASSKLAKTLKALAENGQQVDDLAGSILRLVRDERLGDVPKFNKAVRNAYAKNGWHSGRGRPRADQADLVNVPATVKTYVWEVRRALAADLPVGRYGTFYELRRAMAARQLQDARKHRRQHADPELAGLHLVQPRTFTGRLFHDLAVTYTTMGKAERQHLQAHLARLLKAYAPKRAQVAFQRVHKPEDAKAA